MVESAEENRLGTTLLELTYRCNLDCFFCYNDIGLEGRPVPTSRYFELFEELAQMGVMELALSGGEPLMHPDVFELGVRARQLGFLVRIKSNGHVLTGKVIARIKDEVDPFMVDVSLHGATAEVHERQTRVEGSFDQLLGNLAEARRQKLRFKLNVTLTTCNEHQIEAMYAIADGLGAPLNVNTSVSPKDDGDTEPLSIAPSRDAVRQLADLQLVRATAQKAQLEREGRWKGKGPITDFRVELTKQCGAGSTTLTIDPYGNVYPCTQWRKAVGNIHDATIEQIWMGSSGLDEVRRTSQEAKKLVDGFVARGTALSHCMGLSALKTGDPLGLDPYAVSDAEIHAESDQRAALLPVVS